VEELLGLGRSPRLRPSPFVQLDGPDDFIGKEALRAQAERGIERKLTGVRVAGQPILYNPEHHDVLVDGSKVGRLTSVVYSPRFEANIGFVFVGSEYANPGTELDIVFGRDIRRGVTEPIPFVAPTKSS